MFLPLLMCLLHDLIHAHCIMQPDDIEGKIREIIPAGFTCNSDDFISLLEKEANFQPFGTLLHTYTVHSEDAGELTYQIHKVQASPTPASTQIPISVWTFYSHRYSYGVMARQRFYWKPYCLCGFLPRLMLTARDSTTTTSACRPSSCGS